MKTKIYLAAIVFIFYHGIDGLSANNNTWTSSRQLSLTEKLKAGFNNGTVLANSPAFAENKGQVRGFDGSAHPEVKFEFNQGNTQLFLLEKGIAYQFTKTYFPEGYTELVLKRSSEQDHEKLQEMKKQIHTETFRMDMTLSGASANTEISCEGKSKEYVNFYNHDVLDVHNFTRITYHEVYPGIDWVIYIKDGQIKYDFVVKPGADPSLIQMQFTHQEDLRLDKDGGFTLKNRLGTFSENNPISYQGIKSIPTGFTLTNDVITFNLANYDRSKILVIDPALIWATYYGGSGTETGISSITDAFGNVYLTGYTTSFTGIASGGYQNIFTGGPSTDAYLVKFNSTGVRLWSTYYGSSAADDIGVNCSADLSGNIYMCGNSGSGSGIASGGHQNSYGGDTFDAFLVKFNSNGIRQWATYYGGAGDDFGIWCTLDVSGNVYLAGETESSSGISSGGYQNTFAGVYDGYLVKFNSNGIRLWSTYYGDNAFDGGWSCATDLSGNVYFSGSTHSSAGIASGGFQNALSGYRDAYLVKFNSGGIRQWATYYGGSGFEDGWACATDPTGNVFLTGYTASTLGIASGGHQNTYGGGLNDAFLVKFAPNGSRLWGTYYGGIADDWGYHAVCATDAAGNVFLAGQTKSTNGIASAGYQNAYGGGLTDLFLAKFNGSGVRQWGSYYGGTDEETSTFCTIDIFGNVYLSGTTASPANIASGGHQIIYGGGNKDAFLVKFCDQAPPQPMGISGSTLSCPGSSLSYSVTNFASSYNWSTPGGWQAASSSNSIILIALSSGVLSVTATNACGVSQIQTLSITLVPPPTIAVNSGTVCSGNMFTMVPTGACTYTFSNGSSTVSPTVNSSFSITGTSCQGCVSSNVAVSSVVVLPLPILNISAGANPICLGEVTLLNVSGANTYSWNTNQTTTSIFVSPTVTSVFTVTGTDIYGCNGTTTYAQFVELCTSLNKTGLTGNFFSISPNPSTGRFQVNSEKPLHILLYNEIGQVVFENGREMQDQSISVQGLAQGIYFVKIFSGSECTVRKIVVASE